MLVWTAGGVGVGCRWYVGCWCGLQVVCGVLVCGVGGVCVTSAGESHVPVSH